MAHSSLSSAQRFCEVYSRRPATGLEGQIEGARRRVSQLQLKILQETGSLVVGSSGQWTEHYDFAFNPPSTC